MTENCGCGLTLEFPASNGLVIKNGLPAGGTADQFLRKKSSEDYDAEWTDAPNGIFWVSSKAGEKTTSAEIEEAYQAGKYVVYKSATNGTVLPLTFRRSATQHYFSGCYHFNGHDVLRIGFCDNDTYSFTTLNLDGFIPQSFYGANEFKIITTYHAGDFAVYEGELYRFTAYKAVGDWDETKVEKATFVDEIEELKSRTAIVRFQRIGPESTSLVGFGYIKNVTGHGWSLESDVDQADNNVNLSGYNSVGVRSLPFDPSGEYSLAITMNQYIHNDFDVTVTGGIAVEPVTADIRVGESSWISRLFYCYIVTGDGSIVLTPKT